jgi:glycosyltransferase involved in cell wall biosynthesis
MLSILIPVYNFDVTTLVNDLHKQASAAGIVFEIRCYDDCSYAAFKELNATTSQHSSVEYIELPENFGRSKIRNRLADDARYEQLLFMDCDSQVENDQFIQNYLDHANSTGLVYGGRSYAPQAPDDEKLYLRWFYGVQREVVSAATRSNKPYHSFMTNNFLIPKAIYQAIKLNEDLKGYGHEDTLFGKELQRKNIPIQHIDNPLRHIGLEEAREFLRKTKEGLKNLLFLINREEIGKEVKICRYFARGKKLGVNKTLLKSFDRHEYKIEQNLLSATPNLKRFDYYKLANLIRLDVQSKS